MTRVLLVDDHELVRMGLARLVATADDLEVVGEAADGEEAVRLATETAPDVVLMDLSMPVLDGVEATRRIVALRRPPSADAGAEGGGEAGPRPIQVVVLTSFSDRDRILAALDAGAIGYVLKDSEPEDVVRAVRAAARGDWPIDPRAARLLLGDPDARPVTPALSDRERQVLALVADGLPNKLVARRLGITERTVKAHLTRIYEAIGVTDRTQAALWAQRHGIGAALPG